MAAPKGNQFWKLRSKHGRDYLFKTPQALWDAACEYFAWCENNPIFQTDFRGKDAIEVKIPKIRAFTIQGLVLYCDCSVNFFNQFEEGLNNKTDKTSKDFSLIVTRIREIIYRQKFEGAAAGELNANIIARDLGLANKQEQSVSLPQISRDDLLDLAARINS